MNQSGIMCDHQYLFLMTLIIIMHIYVVYIAIRSQHRGREAVNTVEIVPISHACLAAVAATND
jgi:hypothetical protein